MQVIRETLTEYRKAAAPLPFIAAGGYTRGNSIEAVKSGHTDLVRFYRLLHLQLATAWDVRLLVSCTYVERNAACCS
jgi:2,4-dienoyl-CoA reductase-like NADH-dependent reductase (Old Yellow Enzyme family)